MLTKILHKKILLEFTPVISLLEYLLKNIFIWYVPVSIILIYITQLSLSLIHILIAICNDISIPTTKNATLFVNKFFDIALWSVLILKR